GSELGRRPRRVPRVGLGQGHGPEPEVDLLPDPRSPAAAAQGGDSLRPRARDQHRLDRRAARADPGDLRVFGCEGRAAPHDARAGAQARAAAHHRERDRARALREPDDEGHARPLRRADQEAEPARAHRRARRHGRRGDLPGLARRLLRDWRGAPGRRRERDHDLTPLTDAGLPAWLQAQGVLPAAGPRGGAPGDGNINWVRRVTAADGTRVVVKQARPALERFPQYQVDTERIVYEARYGEVLRRLVPGQARLLPRVLRFVDEDKALVMEDVS